MLGGNAGQAEKSWAGRHPIMPGTDMNVKTTLPLLDDVSEQLDGAVNLLHSQIDRVRAFADSVHGSNPSAAGPGNSPERMGRAGRITDRLDWLRSSLLTLSGEIDRLQSI